MYKWIYITTLAISVGPIIFWFVLSWIYGSRLIRKQWQEVLEAERVFARRPETSLRTIPNPESIAEIRFVIGNAAISPGNFNRWLAGIKSWFGGELHNYTKLVDLARRQALVRMKEVFPEADLYANCKIETSYIDHPKGRGILCVEVSAAATGVRYLS